MKIILLSKFIVLLALFSQLCTGDLEKNECTNPSKNKSRSDRKKRLAQNVHDIRNTVNIVNQTIKKPTKRPGKESDDEFSYLVAGGYRPPENDKAKFLASLRSIYEDEYIFGAGHICGGSILNPKHILTAAHCLLDNSGTKRSVHEFMVVLGTPRRMVRTTNTQEYAPSKFIIHRKYSGYVFSNDIAIVRIKKQIVYSFAIQPIQLIHEKAKAGIDCTVIGWGAVFTKGPLPDEILMGDVTLRSESYCISKSIFSASTMVCASNDADYQMDACQGDSGGPLICGDQQVGIVSHGRGCGVRDTPAYYSDVYYHRDWISQNATDRCIPNWVACIRIISIALLLVIQSAY